MHHVGVFEVAPVYLTVSLGCPSSDPLLKVNHFGLNGKPAINTKRRKAKEPDGWEPLSSLHADPSTFGGEQRMNKLGFFEVGSTGEVTSILLLTTEMMQTQVTKVQEIRE